MDEPLTELLNRAGGGDEDTVDAVYPLIAEKLRRIAEWHLRNGPESHTIQATVLVNDAFINLVDRAEIRWEGRAHFYAVASKAIRRLLITYARHSNRQKRGGGWRRVHLHEASAMTGPGDGR